MEKRVQRPDFEKLGKTDPRKLHEVILSIPKKNLKVIEDDLLHRATPGHQLYQQWFKYDEISELVANEVSSNEVLRWLKNNNIHVSLVTKRKDYIKAIAPISKWEKLLDAEFYEFADHSHPKKIGQQEITSFTRADRYTIPQEMRTHIKAIFHTVQTPPPYQYQRRRGKKYTPFEIEKKLDQLTAASLPATTSTTSPPVTADTAVAAVVAIEEALETESAITAEIELSSSTKGNNGFTTLAYLKSYYGVPANLQGHPAYQQLVYESDDVYYRIEDLTTFQQANNLPIQAALPIGQHNITSLCGTTYSCDYGNFDLQYLMGTAPGTPTIYWWVSSSTTVNSDPFLDWIIAMANEANPPSVASISYSSIEYYQSASVMSAFDEEAMLLTSLGVTLVAASGDNGAPNTGGNGCLCNTASGSQALPWDIPDSWIGRGYFPNFPATCPYVTAVGATMGPNEGSVEITCQSQIGGEMTSGGGFSTYFTAPSWQGTVTSDYLNANFPKQSGYNPLGRGYPDISLLGTNYQFYVDGRLMNASGSTSATPVFVGMISLINAARFKQKLGLVGWLNPTLYAVGINNTLGVGNIFSDATFNDITNGTNHCCAIGASKANVVTCCKSGFNAATGWDPLTGWGSMNFTALTSIFNSTECTTCGATISPAFTPSKSPKWIPTYTPTRVPTYSFKPVTAGPSLLPTVTPSYLPTTTNVPTVTPTIAVPSRFPTISPSINFQNTSSGGSGTGGTTSGISSSSSTDSGSLSPGLIAAIVILLVCCVPLYVVGLLYWFSGNKKKNQQQQEEEKIRRQRRQVEMLESAGGGGGGRAAPYRDTFPNNNNNNDFNRPPPFSDRPPQQQPSYSNNPMYPPPRASYSSSSFSSRPPQQQSRQPDDSATFLSDPE